jgi:phosphomannomutase
MTGSSLKFGTSGLRGLAVELNGAPAFAYARAFAEMLKQDGVSGAAPKGVLIGRDLRDSSPDIAHLCCAAVQDAGLVAINCNDLPTPALAFHGMRFGMASIMVTGSHIPEDRNGLKFYRAEGEIDKRDEERILAHHAAAGVASVPSAACMACGVRAENDPLAAYTTRSVDFFGAEALQGLVVGVYQHSSVARDVMMEVLASLGATPVALGRAEHFVPVDTEALRDEDRALAADWARDQRFDAIVSTDGDADRPLISDETGAFLRGDLVGAITARHLGATVIVTPVTSNSALEDAGCFSRVVRTRVGSPYVIAGMAEAGAGGIVVGFEANGGVLLGSDVTRNGNTMTALPTRDALLPIVSVLAEMKARSQPLSTLATEFAFKAGASNRLKNIANDKTAAFLGRLAEDAAFAAETMAPVGGASRIDAQDGVRVTTPGGDVVHFRGSGNAPELRVYVEAADPAAAETLLAWGLETAARHTA